ncbi:MAG: hypothetical protein WDA41_08170 [Candidatus Neomarinimicrobiota bacterium]
MIYQLATDIEQTLIGRGFPVAVRYGRERTQRELPSSHAGVIVFERDLDTGDRIAAPLTSNRNPRLVRTRALGVTCTIFARSPLAGARQCEHEHDCDQIVDAVIVALYEWGTAARAGAIEYSEARYLRPEDVSGSEIGAGVAYRLRFAVPRGVSTRDWQGHALPEVAITGTTTATRARREGQAWEQVDPAPALD